MAMRAGVRDCEVLHAHRSSLRLVVRVEGLPIFRGLGVRIWGYRVSGFGFRV